MIDESCKVPRENLDDGFNPCRKQVVENGELCQYAHMYDVMNERYDREDETSYLDWVKRNRISQSTPSQSTGGGKVYSQDTNGVEGFISTSETLEPTTNAEIPSSKAVADYVAGAVADYAPNPLPISKGGTGGNTPYVTDDLDNSAVFVMHDAPNDRYDAAPMSSLTGYLDTQYLPVNSILIPPNSDLNEFKNPGKYAVRDNSVVSSIINTPVNLTDAFYIYVFPVLTNENYIGQQLTTYDGKAAYYRYYGRGTNQWSAWTLLYPTAASTIPNPLPISKGGTGGNTPYVTDDLDNSAVFVMHDAPNDRYDAAPMSSLTGYLDTQYLPVNSILIPPNSDLNEFKNPGKYAVRDNSVVSSIINTPVNLTDAFYIYVFPVLTNENYIGQQLTTYDGKAAYYRYYGRGTNQWSAWTLLYPTAASTIPNPLPVDQGGTGAKTRSLKTAAGLTLLPVIDSIGASGALNGYTSVTNIATFITTNKILPEIAAAFENHIADAVADNDLLPTNALMMDYVNAHSMDTPPNKFYYTVSPFPSDTWEGEMTINVLPVFSAKIGADTYVLARVHAYKRFNYTGTADYINLFTSLKPVGDYTGAFIGSTRIPITFEVNGRSNTEGTYGLTPKGSAANLALNNQTVFSVFNTGKFDITSDLKCVFGEGTNAPIVIASIDCPALMLYSAS